MQKKLGLTILAILSMLTLASCSNENKNNQMSDQSETISSLKEENEALKKELKDIQAVKIDETVKLSNIVEVGKTLQEGIYNIQLSGNNEQVFHFYRNREEFEKKDAVNEVLTPNSNGNESDIRKNVKLEKGNILEIEGELNFTRVQ
ncbi:hypothetical protein [Enterococcus gilvus]|uniref:hypothetical protein n=1 Tax=Enterococcus gilvus TaxID=160453 RepID=UPI001C8B7741|nr:hypothetical protein [Enterococcus gilvus]MBX8938925.1 hypothetical protein [Enterococcus gilvus]